MERTRVCDNYESTYQHDYVSPIQKRYEFLQHMNKKSEQEKEETVKICPCLDVPSVLPPKAILDACGDPPWTGIAKAKRLVKPRLLLAELTPMQIKGFAKPKEDCFKVQPNRFLRTLRTEHPDLYTRLRQMPHDELTRRIERNRLLSTYQVDFGFLNEYPEGIYDSFIETSGKQFIEQNTLRKVAPCEAYHKRMLNAQRNIRDPCTDARRPLIRTFVDAVRTVNSGNNSHWRSHLQKGRANFTEYQDSISKNGCVIISNNIHDHSKCIGGRHCFHKLLHNCKHEIGGKPDVKSPDSVLDIVPTCYS